MTAPPGRTPTAPSREQGSHGPRIRPITVLAVFGGILVGALVVALLAALLLERDPEPPECPDVTLECGGPPDEPIEEEPPAPMLRSAGTPWESTELGYEFQFSEYWEVLAEDGRDVTLTFTVPGYPSIIRFEARPAGEASPEKLMQDHLGEVQTTVLGLTQLTDRSLVFLGTPMLGYRDGVGGMYAGTVERPNGPVEDVHVAVLSATDHKITVAMSVVVAAESRRRPLHMTDVLLNTFRWPSENG